MSYPRTAVKIALLEASAKGEVIDVDAILARVDEMLKPLEADDAKLLAETAQERRLQAARVETLEREVERLVRQGQHIKNAAKVKFWTEPGYLKTVLRSIESAIERGDFYVYCLWGDDEDRPLYVGQSEHLHQRLADHAYAMDRRADTRWVTVLRCATVAEMMALEKRLIVQYQPPLNIRLKSSLVST